MLSSSMPPFRFTAKQNVLNNFYGFVGVTVGCELTDRSWYFLLYIYIYTHIYIYIYIYIKEVIVTKRKIITNLNVLIKYVFYSFKNSHIVTSTREQRNLKERTRYIPKINPWFHLKQTELLCRYSKMQYNGSKNCEAAELLTSRLDGCVRSDRAVGRISQSDIFSITDQSFPFYVSSYECHVWRQWVVK
jgi:hypothetical protein